VSPIPSASIVVCEQRGTVYFEAKFRHNGTQIKRRIGPAWLERDPDGRWRPRHGRVPDGAYDERRAHVAAAQIVSSYMAAAADIEHLARERRTQGVTFREVAQGYMRWLADVKGAKPSTLADYRYLLAEPGSPHKRGKGESAGHIMASLGDLPAAKVTIREVEAVLATVGDGGGSSRSVNKHRALISAIFNYGIKASAFNLPGNPASETDKRHEPHPGALVYYGPEEVEALARALADGKHRENAERSPVETAEDNQDAELVRIASYAGLRLGELLALRWSDADFAGHVLTIARAMSLGIESSTKSGRVRRVPLPDQAAAALDRLSRREDYTSPEDRVFCNALGRTLDGSALRRRFKRARDSAGLRPLRFHDLRHTYGSLLAAAGIDLVSIQAVMGHSALSTTSRYLHARPASEQAEAFTRAFEPASPTEARDAPSPV
jgi:integrase